MAFSRRDRLSPVLALAAICLLAGCATHYAPQSLEPPLPPDRIHTEQRENVTVSAAILTDQEAGLIYGVDLAEAGLQAIWLRIDNRSGHSHWLLVSALDMDYFEPDEAATLFHWRLDEEDEVRAISRFRELAMPLKTTAGAVNEGYVLAPRHEGGRYLPVLLMGEGHALSYGFSVPLLDREYDVDGLRTEVLHGFADLPDVDVDGLRLRLRELPCCTTDEDGEGNGDPLNLVLMGEAGDVMSALTRSGWSFTHRINFDTMRRMVGAAISGNPYPVAPISSLYLFDRSQDIAMQRARSNIFQRNHLRLWLAPFRFSGKPVWVGQVSRDIDVKATIKSPTLTTHVVDPNVDEARESLLQSLLISGAVRHFGFVSGAPQATVVAPARNLTDDPFFSDGLRLVVQISSYGSTALQDVGFYDWRDSEDPLRERATGAD
jgi:hypothetical protein